MRIRIRNDGGDEVPYLLDLVLAAGSDEIAGDGLRNEQRGARDADFRLGPWPFPTVEGLQDKVGDEFVGRDIARAGRNFDPFPLLGREADVSFAVSAP